MEFYSTFDIEKILKIKRTRLQEWIKNFWIAPSRASGGRGLKASFTIEDLYAIQLFVELLNMNLERFAAAEITHYVLGRQYKRQDERHVNWNTDYLNLVRLTPIEKDGEYPWRYTPTYGQPMVSHYFQGKGAPGKVPFCQIIIRLRDIKEKVDRAIP